MPRRIKVGMLFECGPQGADIKVCRHFAERLIPQLETGLGIQVIAETRTNKKIMIEEAGLAAKILLDAGCNHVVIVWDLYPPWRSKERPCRHTDREQIISSLIAASISLDRVYLVCIEAELETWLISDIRALDSYIAQRMGVHASQRNIPRIRHPERITNPKDRICGIFRQNRIGDYIDLNHALAIASKVTDLQQLRKCDTFCRFVCKVSNICLRIQSSACRSCGARAAAN